MSVWRITSYMPSHKQFSLAADIPPDRITELTGADPKPSKDGKCKFQWHFFASKWFEGEGGQLTEVVLPCCIWDYKGSRWSAYGPADAFREMGLLP